jgi:hypothetical protein
MTSQDNYCGFSCSDILQKIQEVCDEIKEFSNYNPEYSLVMLGKVMEKVYETRNNLSRMKQKPGGES